MNDLSGKHAIITGAASGIGRATAELMARAGAAIVVADIDDSRGSELAERLQAAGGKASFVLHDVASEESWQQTIGHTLSLHGRLDVLVNNAAVSLNTSIVDTSLDDWRWVMGVNLDGVFLGMKHAIPVMKETGGSIVNVSSTLGIVGRLMSGALSASKAGVRLLTKTAALECAAKKYNVRVNSIHPGGVETEFWENRNWWPDRNSAKRNAQAGRAAILRDTPMGRLGTAEEIARAIIFLASDDASFVNGSELVVDGGYTAT